MFLFFTVRIVQSFNHLMISRAHAHTHTHARTHARTHACTHAHTHTHTSLTIGAVDCQVSVGAFGAKQFLLKTTGGPLN